MNIKNSKKIGFRMTLYCIVFAVFLSAIIGGLGVYTYYQNSRKHFENYLESLLAITRESLETDELQRTIRHSEKNAAYKKAQKQFNDIKDYTDIKYIYFMALTDNRQFEYIICGYDQKELEHPEALVQFKDIVGDEIDPTIIGNFIKVSEGEADDLILLNSSELGDVMSLVLSVKNSQDEIIGILAADISVDQMREDVYSYINSVLLGTSISLIVFLFFFVMAIKRSIIRPIVLIGKQANEFVSQTSKNPSEMVINEIKVNTADELELLARQLQGMMKDMVEYMAGLESMASIQERMNVQLDLVRQIQQGMLPNTFPAFPERTEFDIYASMKPAKEVGGDFYDFFMTDGTHLGVVVADISGEGVPAALFMMRIKTLIKNYAVLGLEPAKVLFETNNELCESNDAGMTAEGIMGILDVYSGEFMFAVAGTNRPYVANAAGEVEEVRARQGFLLGTLANIPFYQERTYLKKHEVLFLFTNGMFRMQERMGKGVDFKLMLGNSVLEESSVQEVVERIGTEMSDMWGNEERQEDLTVLAVKFEGYVI